MIRIFKDYLILNKVKTISFYTLSSLILNTSNLICGFIVYKWIDPYFMGIWQSLLLIQIYSSIIRCGVINGMNRELPYAMGNNDFPQAIKYAETALFYSYLNIALFLIIFSLSFFFIKLNNSWSFPFLTIGIVISFNFYYSYLLGTFRANADFNKLSIIQLINAVLRILTLWLVYHFGFSGFCFREILIIISLSLITHIYRPLKVKPKFDFQIFKILIKTGIPIFIGSYLFNFAFTLPRLILIKTDSIKSLGLYAPLLTMVGAMSILPESIATYFYPKMSYRLGSMNDTKTIWKHSKYVHLLFFIFGIPILIIGYFTFPVIIPNFIPKYIPSIKILNIGLLMGLFLGFKFGYTVLATLKSWRFITIYIGAFLILQLMMPIIFLTGFEPIIAVALGQLSSFTIMYFLSIFTTYMASLNYNKRE